MTLYEWPSAAAFGRVLPKNKIYEHTGANTGLKDLFVREVNQIVWSHKLSPETINIEATTEVAEIQIIRIVPRSAKLSSTVLRSIDRAIPFPTLFEVFHEGRVTQTAAYKRPSETDRAHWVISNYFWGDWLPEDSPRTPLPLALNMGVLYESLIEVLVAFQTNRLVAGVRGAQLTPLAHAEIGLPIELKKRITQAEAIESQAREIERIKQRLGRENQFNKRVAINCELRAAMQELQQLALGLIPTSITAINK